MQDVDRQGASPLADQCSAEKPAISRIVVPQDLDVASMNRPFNAIARHGRDRFGQGAQRLLWLGPEIFVADNATAATADPADRNVNITHDSFLENAEQFAIDHMVR